MLRHVALFRLSDEMTAGQRATAVDALRTLPALVPALRGYRVGLDAGIAEGNWDLAVVADVDDADGWRAYVTHPEHERVADAYLRPFVVERAAVQYDLAP